MGNKIKEEKSTIGKKSKENKKKRKEKKVAK